VPRFQSPPPDFEDAVFAAGIVCVEVTASELLDAMAEGDVTAPQLAKSWAESETRGKYSIVAHTPLLPKLDAARVYLQEAPSP
jgi:hypothetical protein